MLLALILYLFSMEEMRPGTEGGTRWRGVYISSVSCTKWALKKQVEEMIKHSRWNYEAVKYSLHGKLPHTLFCRSAFLIRFCMEGFWRECVRPVGKRGGFAPRYLSDIDHDSLARWGNHPRSLRLWGKSKL